MKLSEKLERMRRQQTSRTAGSMSEAGGVSLSKSTWVLLGLLVVFGALAAWSAFEFFVWDKVPPELAGIWNVKEGEWDGDSFEFFRDGTMERVQTLRGLKKGEVLRTGRISVQEKALVMITNQSGLREQAMQRFVIRELTADTLILEAEKGNIVRMVRK